MATKKSQLKRKVSQEVVIPFGATSRKQQMILDNGAEILIIGGAAKPTLVA